MRCFKKLLYLVVFVGYSAVHAGSYEDFFQAIQFNNAPALQELLDRGVDPNSVSPSGQPALLAALADEHWAVAQTLIAHPAIQVEVRNAKDESPLMLAALKGQLALCEQLIARGADVNKTGWAPLHYAATNGSLPIIQLLLDRYAYIDAESPNGTTPLMMAALYGTIDAVKLLLDAGADVGIKNGLGLTALDFAQKSKKAPSIELVAGAMRALRSKGGW